MEFIAGVLVGWGTMGAAVLGLFICMRSAQLSRLEEEREGLIGGGG